MLVGEIEMGEFLSDYIDEAEQLITKMGELMLKLCGEERLGRSEQGELLNEFFRAAHTLKGSSGFVGLKCVEELAHSLETVLEELRIGRLSLSDELVEAMLQSVDALELLISQLKSEGQLDESIAMALSERLLELSVEGQRIESPHEEGMLPEDMRDVLTEHQERVAIERLKSGMCIYEVIIPMKFSELERDMAEKRDRLGKLGEVIAVLPQPLEECGKYDISCCFIVASDEDERMVSEMVSQVGGSIKRTVKGIEGIMPKGVESSIAIADEGQVKSEPTDFGREAPLAMGMLRTIRVDVHKLDKLLNLVGELMVIQSRYANLERQLRELLKGSRLAEEFERTNRFLHRRLDELRESIFKARMIPLRLVFIRAPRLIRELAKSSGKQIRITIEGEDVEMDRTIVESVAEPLMHLLRNAVDHGIEHPAERQRIGKGPVGNIWLSARQEGNRILIEVRDDGRGIDVHKVAQRAAALGFRFEPESVTNEGLLEILSQPGFSTSSQISHISGRGVGLNAVRRAIENLGGMIELETKWGVGTVFRIRLPVSVAILQVLLSRVGKALCAFPVNSVAGVLCLRQEHIAEIGGAEAYRLDGGIVPLLRMSSLFAQYVGGGSKGFIVLVEAYGMKMGVVVDEPIGLQEVVIKPLPAPLSEIEILIGTAELGDGSLATIVDAQKLVMMFYRQMQARPEEAQAISRVDGELPGGHSFGLAFEAMGRVFLAPVEQVVEVVRRFEILSVPNMPPPFEGVIEWRGKRIPIVDLGKLLNMGIQHDAQVGLIVVNVNGEHVGVVVDRVLDVVEIELSKVQLIRPAAGIIGISKSRIRGREIDCLLIDVSSCIKGREYSIVQATD